MQLNLFSKRRKRELRKNLRVNLHSIRFTSIFVLFLRFCFFLKKYARFHLHVCKSISALSRLLYIDKNFVYERQQRYFKISMYSFAKIFFRTTFAWYGKFSKYAMFKFGTSRAVLPSLPLGDPSLFIFGCWMGCLR